jgi:DNA-binding transcriptional ArsR family regulator/predicted nucleotidyltransferase
VSDTKFDIHTSDDDIHSVSEPRPSLLPLPRSENQLDLLAALVLAPTRVWSIAELVEPTGLPQPSVSRELRRLADVGLVRISGRVNARQVQVNAESVIFPELHGLMLKSVGPKPVLEDALQHVPGIDGASIYGSWARRYQGEAGTEPHDIDVLVVGNPDVDLLCAVVEQAAATLGRDVNSTMLTSKEWSGGTSSCVTQLHDDALVELDLFAR